MSNGTNPYGSSQLAAAVHALRNDLLAEGGPRISTMRNYRFAILVYDPSKEFELRRLIRRLGDELRANEWNVLAISLQQLFFERLRRLEKEEPGFVGDLITDEKYLIDQQAPDRALKHLKDELGPLVDAGDNAADSVKGIAADVIRLIGEFADSFPTEADRTLILLGRAGALYPFFRSSALLKQIDGQTRNLPVVLLYPGERHGKTQLSFMGVLEPDSDYRPRIYS